MKASMSKRSLNSTRKTLPNSASAAFDYFYAQGCTDGLPIIPPTEDLVEMAVASTGRAPSDVVACLPPTNGAATVEKIAVNAIIAGCRPEYMGVLIAAVEALSDSRFRLEAVQLTMNPIPPCLVVNGPIRKRLDVNCGTGVMGPGWRANATIGRAIRLVLINIGGAVPAEVDKSTQGFVGKYTFCIGENEEASPWAPYHVENGFAPDDSTLTAFGVNASISLHDGSPRWEDLLHSVVHGLMVATAGNYTHPHAEAFIILNPLHAQILAAAGYTKGKLKAHLWEHARIPVAWLSEFRKSQRMAEGREYFEIDGNVPLCSRKENFALVVAGGMEGSYSSFLPTAMGHSVTRRIGTVPDVKPE